MNAQQFHEWLASQSTGNGGPIDVGAAIDRRAPLARRADGDRYRPRWMGHGWRERLVADVVAAVEEVERG